MRDALVWLGEEDPVAAVDYGNDGSGEMGMAFATIQAVAQAKLGQRHGAEFRANDLSIWACGHFALRDALEQAGCIDPTKSGQVGFWLRAHKNRIADGLKLTMNQVNGGKLPAKWSLQTPDQGLGAEKC